MKIFKLVEEYINDKEYSMIYKNNKLNIINYTEIGDFSSSLISVKNKNTIYHIEGENLVIVRMMDSEILITGNIKRITFI